MFLINCFNDFINIQIRLIVSPGSHPFYMLNFSSLLTWSRQLCLQFSTKLSFAFNPLIVTRQFVGFPRHAIAITKLNITKYFRRFFWLLNSSIFYFFLIAFCAFLKKLKNATSTSNVTIIHNFNLFSHFSSWENLLSTIQIHMILIMDMTLLK